MNGARFEVSRAGAVRGVACAFAINALAAFVAGCGDETRSVPERIVWVPGGARNPVKAGFGAASMVVSGDVGWIAYTEREAGRDRVRIRRATGVVRQQRASAAGAEPALVAAFDGHTPCLTIGGNGEPFVVYGTQGEDDKPALVLRNGRAGGTTWSEPRTIVGGHYVALAPNRLVRLRDGGFVIAVLADAKPACARSPDGVTWTLAPMDGWPSAARWPAIVEAADGSWVGFGEVRTHLVRTTSKDAGVSWTQADTVASLPRMDVDQAFAATSTADGALLAWTEMPPDLVLAEPHVWTLRCARLTQDGRSLLLLAPLARRAGTVPALPSLYDAGGAGVLAWFTQRSSRGDTTAVCLRIDPAARTALQTDDTRTAAIVATDLWMQHALRRPSRSRRLFVESYTMRGVVAAQAALAPIAAAGDVLLGADLERGIPRALAYAESLLAKQDEGGHWSIGYNARYVADMAVVIGLYAAVAPHADHTLRQRFVESAQRFAAGIEADSLVSDDGGIGVGWVDTSERPAAKLVRAPSLISTALAGIETQAWLYACTGDAEHARRARAALDYTLAALQPDGSLLPPVAPGVLEGAYWASTYVQEGWMAAYMYLRDARVGSALRRALPAHVAWLVRTQNPDGTWGERATGETARTVAIPNFLIWYDRHCESRADVRAAIRRAAATLVDPDRWLDAGMLYQGNQEDAHRALAARSLVAMAADEPVP